MRDFVDGILLVIDASSLTDEEFATITQVFLLYSLELYTEIMSVLDSRETVSNTRDRLTYYFLARGVSVTASSSGQSNIFVGGVLAD